jgi:hypothetical protein
MVPNAYRYRVQVQQSNTGLSDDHKNKIMDTVIALNILLDVPKPYTWIVHVSAEGGGGMFHMFLWNGSRQGGHLVLCVL